MKYFVILSLVLLIGCQPDRYTAVDDADNSSDARWSTWRACMKEASNNPDLQHGLTGEQLAGAAAMGVVGGAIGGAIFGAAMASGNEPAPNSADAYVRKCMADKGYKYKGAS